MKSIRLTLMTALWTAALGLGAAHADRDGRDSRPDRRVVAAAAHVVRITPVQSLLRKMDSEIRHLEEDLEREELRHVRGYANRLERLADRLDETRRREGVGEGRRVTAALRALEGHIRDLRRQGEAGRLRYARAEARRVHAQFIVLADRLGYSFR